MSKHTISITIRADEQVILEVKQVSKKQKGRFGRLLGCSDKTVYDWLTLLSSILLPFAIALFTIAITMQENKEQRENRERDLEIAALRRRQDRDIAEQQRNETILSHYLKDISTLILRYGHQLLDTRARITASSMTLTAIQQLNTEKKQFLVRYLYRMTFIDRIETDQPFSLFGADLSGISLTDPLVINTRFSRNYRGLYLPYVYLTNASFMDLKMSYVDFVHSDLIRVNFSYTSLEYSNFKSSQLQECDFRHANVSDADFTNANLTGAFLSDEQLQEAAFLDYAIFPNGSVFAHERRNTNVLSATNWTSNGTLIENLFNRSIITDQKQKTIISQDVLLGDYAKVYWINREKIAYTLSTVLYGKNIKIQLSLFNMNGTLLQIDRLEQYQSAKNYHETNGLCLPDTYRIRVEIILLPSSKTEGFIEYTHLNLTAQYNIRP